MRNFGMVNRDKSIVWGYNSRLDSLQCATLLVKLPYLDSWNAKRRANAEIYRSMLAEVVSIPQELPYEYCVYHTFVIQTEKRDALKDYLERKGVGSRVHYPIPIHLQPASRHLGYNKGDFPQCEAQAERILSLPVHHALSESQIGYVVEMINKYYKGLGHI